MQTMLADYNHKSKNPMAILVSYFNLFLMMTSTLSLAPAQEKGRPMEFSIHPIGIVRSSLKDLSECPHQGNEGAPEAWIELDPKYGAGLDGIQPGSEVVILTWLHLADRTTLFVHPRGDKRNPLTGVFRTRSPDRPNPIGLHRATVLELEPPARILVKPLEAMDNTPVLDIKCVRDESK